MKHAETITRRNLPHWYVPGAMHFVTYRLAGTIPVSGLMELREKKMARLQQKAPEGMTPSQYRQRINKLFFAEYDGFLDRNRTIDWLAQPAIAATIRGNLYHHKGSLYDLLAFCVMPNHVHVLLQPKQHPTSGPLVATGQLVEEDDEDEKDDARSPLATIMHSLKSYTAHEANKLLKRSGQFWQHESFDHWVRDDDELERIVDYIAWNPVKAKLVEEPHAWYFCSAHDRFLQDGSKAGYLSHTS